MSMRIKTPLPSLEGATQWLNDEPNLEAMEGKPIFIYFWAVSCHVCHNNMPKLQTWRELYVPKGLEMIAIHCPRMKTDTNIEQVKSAVKGYGIVEPCGIDNMHKLKKAFENEFWPAYFLFDRDKSLKCRAAGNKGLSMLTPTLEEMFD